MKVVHTLLRYPPAAGGVEDYTEHLVEGIRKKHADVRVETTNLKTHHPPSLLPETHDPEYVHRHAVHTFHAIGYPIPEGLAEELEALPMDILHAHAFWYAPADIAARVAKRRKIPFVINPYYVNIGNRKSVKWQLYRSLYGRHTIAAADAVVVISPYEERQLLRDRFTMQRVELIPPGIQESEFTTSRPNPFPRFGVPENADVLLFAGRIAKAKGPDLAIRALPHIRKKHPTAHLVLVGEDFGFQRACELLASSLGVSDAITWTGRVSREDLIAAYTHADIFLFPSRFEAFGIVLLEAAAAGCPAVAPRTSAIPYVVQDKHTGLLYEPENVDDLVQQTLALLTNTSFRETLRQKGMKRAREEFSWEKSIEKMWKLYTDLARTQ